ncbi:MAG: MFS transporter [Anaerolineaceae bacterium]|nr:MFS transporter [Anaerolineaceae bacterium]
MTTLASPQSSPVQTKTLAALQYPNFRLYFFGQVISLSGTWMQVIAQGWLVFHLTQQEVWLGIVAAAAGLPSLLLSPFAGVLVDRYPRRTILIISQTIQMLLAFILAALTFAGVVQVYHIVGLAFLLGVTNAIDAPSRQSIIVELVGHKDLSSGIALNAIMFNGARIIGPAVAGILLNQVGPAWCFAINGASFLAVIFMLVIMRVAFIPRPNGLPPLKRLQEGVTFSRRHMTIAPLLLLAVTAAIFIVNISTLLPAFADVVLHSPVDGFAAMSTALGVGALLAAISVTPMGRRFGRGRVVMMMSGFVAVIGLMVTRMTEVTPSVILMTLFGFGIILQFVTVNTLIQDEVPDEFRGRVMSLYTLAWFGFAPFGALALGSIAEHIGTPDAMALFTLAGGGISLLILARSPGVRRLR